MLADPGQALLPAAALQVLRHPEAAPLAALQAWLALAGNRLIVFGSGDYPPQLARLPDAPALLFVAGDSDALWLPQISVVGSRSAINKGTS